MSNTIPCPYCQGHATYHATSDHIYGKDYGPVYDCRPCDAYVGVHKGSMRSKGTPADRWLRGQRRLAHLAFDPIWRGGSGMSRDQAYAWLALALALGRAPIHIGESDGDTCHQIIQACKAMMP